MQDLRENIRKLFLADGDYRTAYIKNFKQDGKALLLFLVYKGIISQAEFDEFVKTAIDISISTEVDALSDDQLKSIANTITETVELTAALSSFENLDINSNSDKE